MIKIISVMSIRNNVVRRQVGGIWQNVVNQFNGLPMFNPKSVTIELDGHIDHSVMNKLSVVTDGSISGKALLSKCEAVCKDQGIEPKLTVEPDAEYLVVRQMDKATNKMMSYRHSGFEHRKTGELVDRTYIKLEIVEPDRIGTTVSDI